MAVVGPVGAGKVRCFIKLHFNCFNCNHCVLLVTYIQSSLLQCLLGELPALKGCVTVRGSVAYASQESWLFSGTLRENIMFGLPYNADWYNTVVDICALDKV